VHTQIEQFIFGDTITPLSPSVLFTYPISTIALVSLFENQDSTIGDSMFTSTRLNGIGAAHLVAVAGPPGLSFNSGYYLLNMINFRENQATSLPSALTFIESKNQMSSSGSRGINGQASFAWMRGLPFWAL